QAGERGGDALDLLWELLLAPGVPLHAPPRGDLLLLHLPHRNARRRERLAGRGDALGDGLLLAGDALDLRLSLRLLRLEGISPLHEARLLGGEPVALGRELGELRLHAPHLTPERRDTTLLGGELSAGLDLGGVELVKPLAHRVELGLQSARLFIALRELLAEPMKLGVGLLDLVR